MTKKKKNHESSVTDDMIKKVHVSLADIKSGEELLMYLHQTEPIFMQEVTRFSKIEMDRLTGVLPFPQVVFLGSVVGAAYICGYLIAKEAHAQLFDKLIDVNAPVNKVCTKKEIEALIDKGLSEGKTYKAISKNINKILTLDPTKESSDKCKKKKNKKTVKKKDEGKRIDLGDIG